AGRHALGSTFALSRRASGYRLRASGAAFEGADETLQRPNEPVALLVERVCMLTSEKVESVSESESPKRSSIGISAAKTFNFLWSRLMAAGTVARSPKPVA